MQPSNPESLRTRLHQRFREALGEGSREEGSAVVEFTFLALLLMVPLVYFIITVGLSRAAQG